MQRHWVQRVYRPTEYILWTCLHFTSNLDVIFYKISTDFKCKHSLFLRGSITKYIKSIHLHYIHLLHIIYGVNNPCSIYKNLSLINTIIFFPSQDKFLSCQFWMVTKWYKSQIMAHYKWHLCFKTVFCQHWWDKKVSTSANTLHRMRHILKSAWRTCPSPPIKHWVTTTSTMHKTKRKTSSKMALFLHVT